MGDPPYYSLQVTTPQDIPFGGQIGTRRCYFQNWSANPTAGVFFENANSTLTKVKFYNAGINIDAVFQGQGLSNDNYAFYPGSQRKFVKSGDEALHYVYSSLGHIWYERSTDNGSTWVIENNHQPIDNGNGKLPSIDQSGSYGNDEILVTYQEKNGNGYVIKLKVFVLGTQRSEATLFNSTQSYDINSNPPVVAVSSNSPEHKFMLVFQNGSHLQFKYGHIQNETLCFYAIEDENISGTDQYSINPTITANKTTGNSGSFFIAWQKNNTQIYYKRLNYSTNNQITYDHNDPNPVYYSNGSPYTYNWLPSISIVGSAHNPVISWIGHNGAGIEKVEGKEEGGVPTPTEVTQVVVRRGSNGAFGIAGNSVDNANNNSTSEATAENTVIVWSEGNPAVSKWFRRNNDGTYTATNSLSNSGIELHVSNGSDLSAIKAMVFSTQTTPYSFIQSTTDFSVEQVGGGITKISDLENGLTFGRMGIVGKNGVQFVFNVGDIILADTNVQFIYRPDTLLYTNTDELNQDTRSLTIHLNNQSQLYFTDYYYTVNSEIADSVLTDSDAVSFS
jgi:hypothetical protein